MRRREEDMRQNQNVRVIASDLDGTLLTPDKQVTSFTREILAKAVSRGVHFVPCTGRPFDAVPQSVRELPGVEYVIASNGAAVYSVSLGRRIYERLLNEETVEKILQLPLPQEIATEVLVEGIPYTEERYIADPARFGATEYGIQYIKETRRGLADIRSFLREHRAQTDGINFICADPALREQLAGRLCEQCQEITLTSSVPHLIEVSHRQSDKGQTLLWLLSALKLSPEEAMAFGDAENDIPMLCAVRYGIAMENAAEHCKEAAFAVTGSNTEDGVARKIQEMLWL